MKLLISTTLGGWMFSGRLFVFGMLLVRYKPLGLRYTEGFSSDLLAR